MDDAGEDHRDGEPIPSERAIEDVGDLTTSPRLLAIAASMPEHAEFLRALVEELRPPWHVRRDRLDERDEAIKRCVQEHLAGVSIRAAAGDMAAAMAIETTLASPLASDARRVELRRILIELCRGRSLSVGQLRDILAGER